jgi:hypothetical protein
MNFQNFRLQKLGFIKQLTKDFANTRARVNLVAMIFFRLNLLLISVLHS